MKIDNPTGDPDCRKPQYTVRFEEREVEEIHYAYSEKSFERVQAVSEWAEMLYKNTVSPWIRIFANPRSAEILKSLQPLRASHTMFSEKFNPWMIPVKTLAPLIAQERISANERNRFVAMESDVSASISGMLDSYRKIRDAVSEQQFSMLYGRD